MKKTGQVTILVWLTMSFGYCAGEAAYRDVVPVRNLIYTPEEIVQVRETVEADAVAGMIARQFIREADKWVERSWDEVTALFPAPDAVFAYGFAGDPKVDKPWSWWGRDGEASLERPFVVESPHTGDIYGDQEPGDRYYDDGSGWVRPEDGKIFYFQGVWNAHVIRVLHEAVDNLSVGYMLTGDDSYAERALLILDQMATMRSRRPEQDGPIDWPHPVPPGYGFFLYAGNVANSRMMASAMAFDLVGRHKVAARPSPGNGDLTIFENIRRNYFSVFEEWYVDRRNSFQNHAISAFASMLTQAVLFGYPEDIERGIEAAFGLIDNTIDRDGEYYELSSTYAYLGRIYGSRLLTPLKNYRPENYEEPERFPDPGNYPNELRFGDDRIWFNTVVASLYRLTTLYRQSQYGDAPADRFTREVTTTTRPEDPNRSLLWRQRVIYLKEFYHATENPEWKRLCRRLYWDIPENVRNNARYIREGILELGPGQWGNLPAPDMAPEEVPADLRENESIVTGQKRLAILRSGKGPEQRALFIRGGAATSHAHNDQMALALYSHGMSLTGEYGYRLAGTPDHRGWGVQSVAHKMVVVDENLPEPIPGNAVPPAQHTPPARIDGYVPFEPAQLIEMSNPKQWPHSGLEDYRRQAWMIDLVAEQGYFVDVFWVDGGHTHDYVWNVPYVDNPDVAALKLEGVSPDQIEGVWTLAALGNPDWEDASFNQRGKSWGERLEVGSGTIRDAGVPGEVLTSHNWNPDPGNGYGFIWDVRAARSDADWHAEWLLHDQKHRMKVTMLNPDGQMVVTGKTPTQAAGRSQNVLIARRQNTDEGEKEPFRSRFVTVSQVTGGNSWPLSEVQLMDGLDSHDVGLVIRHAGGGRDVIFTGRSDDSIMISDELGLRGRRGFVRRDSNDALVSVMLSEGTRLESKGIILQLAQPGWEAKVKAVSPRTVLVDAVLPPNAMLRGQGVVFESPEAAALPYSSNEFFTVESTEEVEGGTLLSFERQSVSASRLQIKEVGPDTALRTFWPNEVSAVPARAENGSRVFEGRLVLSEADLTPVGRITSYAAKDRLILDRMDGVETNHHYLIMATQPGDRVRIPGLALVRRTGFGEWTVRANMDVRLKIASSSGLALVRKDGRKVKLELDRDGLAILPVSLLSDGEALLRELP